MPLPGPRGKSHVRDFRLSCTDAVPPCKPQPPRGLSALGSQQPHSCAPLRSEASALSVRLFSFFTCQEPLMESELRGPLGGKAVIAHHSFPRALCCRQAGHLSFPIISHFQDSFASPSCHSRSAAAVVTAGRALGGDVLIHSTLSLNVELINPRPREGAPQGQAVWLSTTGPAAQQGVRQTALKERVRVEERKSEREKGDLSFVGQQQGWH